MIRLLLDMGLPRRTAGDLRALGWDVVHAAEAGRATATDADLAAFAAVEGRFIITLDADFARLVATTGAVAPSVVHVRLERLDRARATALLERLIPDIEADLVRGAIVAVASGGVRVRPLPVR